MESNKGRYSVEMIARALNISPRSYVIDLFDRKVIGWSISKNIDIIDNCKNVA